MLDAIEASVRKILTGADRHAHGWMHTERVRGYAVALAHAEGVDPILAELAALLHDVGRTQPGPVHEHGARSAVMGRSLVQDATAERVDAFLGEDDLEAVFHAVRWHNSSRSDTPLLCLLRDADMLDGLGAIGIMRALMSESQLPAYDSSAPFEAGGDRWPAQYMSDRLLGQMDWYHRLHTETARQMAAVRFRYMEGFLAQARSELVPDSTGCASNGDHLDGAAGQARPGAKDD